MRYEYLGVEERKRVLIVRTMLQPDEKPHIKLWWINL